MLTGCQDLSSASQGHAGVAGDREPPSPSLQDQNRFSFFRAMVCLPRDFLQDALKKQDSEPEDVRRSTRAKV
jgi:hypothetical protein